MPCRTAFSTSGCRISGGTGTRARRPASTDVWTRSRAPNRTCSIAQVLLGQRDFAAERDARRRRRASGCRAGSPPSSWHICARLVRIGADQPGDRVEAVEQKVRIDLRAQRAQLGVALRDLRLQRAPRRRRRFLERLQHVVHRHATADTPSAPRPTSSANSAAIGACGQLERRRAEQLPPAAGRPPPRATP